MIKNFKIKSYKINLEKIDIVTLQSNLFLELYCLWNGTDEVNDDLILVMLNNDYETALKQCIDGITINGEKYIAYIATPSMQKKEEYNTKCEMWFIRESKKDFIDYFENLISLGTISQYLNKEICINKKVTSRIALAMSTVIKTSLQPRFCIVDNKKVDIVQDVMHYTYEDDTLTGYLYDKKKIEHEQHDGMGLMLPSFANKIKKDLNLNHRIDYCVVRQSGLAVKGALVKFDYVDYIEKYCSGNYIIKDIYGNDVDLREVDIIYTKSQVKWADNFNSINDYYNRLSMLDDKEKDLIGSLYITKTNKSKNKIKKYTLTNYQLLSNLGLNYDDYIKLAARTMVHYNNVYNANLPDIKYFLKEFADDDPNFKNYDEDEQSLAPTNKIQYLLNINEDFLKSSFVKEILSNAVKNKIALASTGKIYIKGNCKYIATSPFLLINNLLGIDRVILEKNQFYIANNANKKFTISRNPLASPWEIKNIETVNNELFNEYFGGFTEEVIFFNGLDYTHAQLSGADEDSDLVACLEDEIIYNNVITNKYLFYHVSEGETKSMIYNNENKFKSLLLSSGNLIGKLSIAGAKVSNKCLFGTKANILENFRNNQDILMFLTELEMAVIDAPKSLSKPSDEDMEVVELDEKKPLFLKYSKGYNKPKKVKNYGSHFEKFAERVMRDLDKVVNDETKGSNIIKKYIFTENIEKDDDCINETKELRKKYVKEINLIRNKKILSYETIIDSELVTVSYNNPNYLDLYKNCLAKYQLLFKAIEEKYQYRVVCNSLVALNVSDKFIINFFFDSMRIKLNEKYNTAKVLKERINGEYEFFGKRYNLVDVKLADDNLVEKELKKVIDSRPEQTFEKEGIISIGLIEDVETLLDKTFKVIQNGTSIDLLDDNNEKVTYGFINIKDMNNKKTDDILLYYNKIIVREILKKNLKSLMIKINY